MSLDSELSNPGRRIQSLVHYCQRVAGNHVDSISSLGDLSFSLVKPLLERCSAEQLLRLEHASPHLQRDSEELWRSLCFRTYPAIVERYQDGTETEPESWRNQFFVLKEAEARRLEEVGSRIRSQRREAEERKKEREVKFTDRMPPPKRARSGWNAPAQPKTLFQKTRSEASKMQKNMYTARMIPPMPKVKDYRASTSTPILRSPQTSYPSRVTVNTVVRRPPSSTTDSAAPGALVRPQASNSPPSKIPSLSSSEHHNPSSPPGSQQPLCNEGVPFPSSSDHLLSKPSPVAKKDPMASLFVPKHRAYSQRTR